MEQRKDNKIKRKTTVKISHNKISKKVKETKIGNLINAQRNETSRKQNA